MIVSLEPPIVSVPATTVGLAPTAGKVRLESARLTLSIGAAVLPMVLVAPISCSLPALTERVAVLKAFAFRMLPLTWALPPLTLSVAVEAPVLLPRFPRVIPPAPAISVPFVPKEAFVPTLIVPLAALKLLPVVTAMMMFVESMMPVSKLMTPVPILVPVAPPLLARALANGGASVAVCNRGHTHRQSLREEGD